MNSHRPPPPPPALKHHRHRIAPPPRPAMSTPPPIRRRCSPPSRLVDDLIPEILLRIPPDDPACLARASLACKPWRSVLTDPGFLRRYRAFHGTPPMLGSLRNTYSGGIHSTATVRFVPTSSFRPAAPDRRGMYAIAARHGRVLLHAIRYTPGPLSLVVWDPVTDEQWTVPPLPATRAPLSSCYNATVFCAAAGCDHLDCHGGPFAVALVGSYEGPDRVVACVYSSEAGEWGEPTVLQGVLFPISHHPVVLVGEVCYFTSRPSFMKKKCTFRPPSIVEYDMARGKLSTFGVPSWHKNQPTGTLTVTEDDRLGFACLSFSELLLWSWEASPRGAMTWELRRNVELNLMHSSRDGMDAAPGRDPQHKVPPCAIAFADGAGVVFVMTEAGAVFSVELKSGRAQETSLPSFHGYEPQFLPYLSFYTPVVGPSMKSLQIDKVEQVDLEGDINGQVQHSGDADKQRLMGESVDEQRQVWDSIDEQQKLRNQEERRQKQDNKKRKLELKEWKKKSDKIYESKMIRAEGGGSRSARKLSQRVTKSPLGRLPLVRSPGVNMLRYPLGVLASLSASERGRYPSARVEFTPIGKRAKSSVRSPCMSRSQSMTTSPLGGLKIIKSHDRATEDLHHREEM